MTKGVFMDDQNQANNQFGNQPKKPDADVTSSAPVEAEPATDSTATPTPPVSTPPTPAQPPVTPTPQVSQPTPTSTQPSGMPTAPTTPPEEEKMLEMPPQPELLEAPKKKNGMLVAGITAVLVVVLAVGGYVVYMAMK